MTEPTVQRLKNQPEPDAPFRQPEVGDAVTFCTDIDGDGWPEIRTGEIIEVTQDYVRVKNANDQFDLNPDWNTQVSAGPLTVGRWKYMS